MSGIVFNNSNKSEFYKVPYCKRYVELFPNPYRDAMMVVKTNSRPMPSE